MSSFKLRYVVIPVLVLGIMGGTAAVGLNKQSSKNIANVVTVSEANEPGFLEDMAMESSNNYIGKLKKGSVQYVKLNEKLVIQDMLVKKGDTVKKGDRLFTYDLNSIKIALAEAENTLSTCENEIKVAENELAVLKKLQPSENAPKVTEYQIEPEDEPEQDETVDLPQPEPVPEFKYEKKITAKTAYESGAGTEQDPYVYYVGEDTVVTKEALLMLCPTEEEAKYAVLYVCDETGTPMYARLLDGNKIDPEKAADWKVNDGVVSDVKGSISFDGGSAGFASFTVQSQKPEEILPDIQPEFPESFEDLEQIPEMPVEEPSQQPVQQPSSDTDTDVSDEITEKDNYVYSKDELKSMISEKEKQIEKLNMNKSQYELNVRKEKKNIDVGAELSQLDGKVTFIAKDTKHLSENGSYMTITSTQGTSITSSIGEFSLSKAKLGGKVKISDYESGSEYTGEITFISDVPMTEEQYGKEDNMQSYYEFIVTSKERIDLAENGSVSLSFDNGGESESFALEGIFVRSEGDKYYVMAANDDNIIEKRYVTVGQKQFFAIEITGGLSKDDRIAIAYGKTKEGMQAVDADYSEVVYGTGLLF